MDRDVGFDTISREIKHGIILPSNLWVLSGEQFHGNLMKMFIRPGY